VGRKKYWLKDVFPDARFFDLLESSLYLELSRDPGKLEFMVGKIPKGLLGSD